MIPPYFESVRHLTSLRARPVLLQGCSGTGKTKVVQALQGNFSAIDPVDRTDSRYVQFLRHSRLGARIGLSDMPGDFSDDMFRDERDDAVDAARGRARIILNTVSFGYHTIGILDHASPKSLDELEEQRWRMCELELNAIVNWADFTFRDLRPIALATVITKPDLWWSRRDEVLNWYSTGPYAQAVADHTNTGGNRSLFQRTVLECQLIDGPSDQLGSFRGFRTSMAAPTTYEVGEMRRLTTEFLLAEVAQ